jgi:DNA-binding NtrC family response regulator
MKVTSETVVVTSDLFNRRHLIDILNNHGVEPFCLSTLRECREILRERSVGLLFCDREVSDGNYKDLLAICNSWTRKPRVVVTSPDIEPSDVKEAMQLGAFHVISSPCRPADVEWMLIQAKRDEGNQNEPVFETVLGGLKLTGTAMASGS